LRHAQDGCRLVAVPRLLLVPAALLIAVGLWLATVAGAEDQPTVRAGVYGPDSCDNNSQQVDTAITKAPKKKTRSTKARIEFAAFYCSSPDVEVDQDSFSFSCKLDKEKASDCKSPVKLSKLKKGKHKFSVSANFSGAENSFGDPTGATAKWKIVD
jgi:hypothetical protein